MKLQLRLGSFRVPTLCALLCPVWVLFSSTLLAAQEPEPICGIEGSLVLAGHGETPDCVLQGFLFLCGVPERDLVVIQSDSRLAISEKRWLELGASSVQVIKKFNAKNKQHIFAMLEAEGVWFEGAAKGLEGDEMFQKLLTQLRQSDGVVGAASEGVGGLVASAGKKKQKRVTGFDLLPHSVVRLIEPQGQSAAVSIQAGGGLVEWQIPESTGLFFHHQRQVGALGQSDVHVHIPAHNGWPSRSAEIESIDVFDYGDHPPYAVDLLAWVRSAKQYQGPVFPAAKVLTPKLKNGTLFLHGGAGVDDLIFEEFIQAAGGWEASIVCIPSASQIDDGDELSSYSARRLRQMGCSNVVVMHTDDPRVANDDDRFLEPLLNADAVWIDGGRTYRFMDSYQHTRVHQLIRELLARDGVVGGSSAGCQVAGDFLVRGNPRSNSTLVYEGYTTGLALIEGVILDAHFLQRSRSVGMIELIREYPQMLGVGVDENTALIVRGGVGRVIGDEAVSFFQSDADGGEVNALALYDGESFDLGKRAQIEAK